MPKRTNIYLPEDQLKRLKKISTLKDLSVSEIVRPEHRRVFNQRRTENEEALETRKALLKTVERYRRQRDLETG